MISLGITGAVDYEVGDTHEVEVRTLVYGSFFFVRMPLKFTAKFIAILTKVHRFQRIQR